MRVHAKLRGIIALDARLNPRQMLIPLAHQHSSHGLQQVAIAQVTHCRRQIKRSLYHALLVIRWLFVLPTFQAKAAIYRSIKLLLLDRLGDVIVHPSLQATLAITRHGIGGHGDDIHLTKIIGNHPATPHLARPDRFCCFNTVHHRHLHIHEDQIKMTVLKALHGFSTVIGQRHETPALFQQALGQFLIDRIILNQKYRQGSRVMSLCLVIQRERIQKTIRFALLRKDKTQCFKHIFRSNRLDEIRVDTEPTKLTHMPTLLF